MRGPRPGAATRFELVGFRERHPRQPGLRVETDQREFIRFFVGISHQFGRTQKNLARLAVHIIHRGVEHIVLAQFLITDHHIFHSIYFFDPNGVRLELTSQLADEFQMLQESKTAHARLAEWTARKELWRRDRAAGKATDALKPQQNDRPELVGPK